MEQIRFGVCRRFGGPFVLLIFKLRMANKPRIIILLHGKLVTCNFRFPKNRKVFIFMVFGPRGHVHDPKANYDQLWRHKKIRKKRKSNNLFGTYSCIPPPNFRNQTFAYSTCNLEFVFPNCKFDNVTLKFWNCEMFELLNWIIHQRYRGWSNNSDAPEPYRVHIVFFGFLLRPENDGFHDGSSWTLLILESCLRAYYQRFHNVFT